MNTGLIYNQLPGPPLSEQGRGESAAAAFLADKGIEQLFFSPFDRTGETAALIAAQLAIPTTTVKALAEQGPAETTQQVRARVAELLDGLEDSPYQRVALVTHGSP